VLWALLFVRRDRVFRRLGRPAGQRRAEAPAFEEPTKEPSDLHGDDRVDCGLRPDAIPAEDGRRLKLRARLMIGRELDGHPELRLYEPTGNAGEVAIGHASEALATDKTYDAIDEGSILVA